MKVGNSLYTSHVGAMTIEMGLSYSNINDDLICSMVVSLGLQSLAESLKLSSL